MNIFSCHRQRELTYVHSFPHYRYNFVGEVGKNRIAHTKSRYILSVVDNHPLKRLYLLIVPPIIYESVYIPHPCQNWILSVILMP